MTLGLASAGYPASAGDVICGLDDVPSGIEVTHAGTALRADCAVVTTGGRVLNVTARGSSVAEAQRAAYAAVDALDFPTGFCRRDIGWREIEREAAPGA